ncbi:hypothetical protein DITRI_Ditri10aG0039400 [Diplodiscus trichospermus]
MELVIDWYVMQVALDEASHYWLLSSPSCCLFHSLKDAATFLVPLLAPWYHNLPELEISFCNVYVPKREQFFLLFLHKNFNEAIAEALNGTMETDCSSFTVDTIIIVGHNTPLLLIIWCRQAFCVCYLYPCTAGVETGLCRRCHYEIHIWLFMKILLRSQPDPVTSFIQIAAFFNMSVFYQEEQPRHSKRCKFIAAVLKEAFSNCHSFNGPLSNSGPEEEYSSDIDDESEVVVSEIRSRAMEKMKRRPSLMADSFYWVLSPSTGELYMTSKHAKRQDKDNEDEEREDFFSVGSCFSFCSSAVSREAFLSAKTNFSRCSSLNKIDFPEIWKFDIQDFRRRSIIQELCHCEGWPFGLCRKLVLLPPLPKSPSESWSWRKGTRLAKTPYV